MLLYGRAGGFLLFAVRDHPDGFGAGPAMDIRPDDGYAPTVRIASCDGIGVAIRPLERGDAVAGFGFGDFAPGNPIRDYLAARIGHAQAGVFIFAWGGAAGDPREKSGGEPNEAERFHS